MGNTYILINAAMTILSILLKFVMVRNKEEHVCVQSSRNKIVLPPI